MRTLAFAGFALSTLAGCGGNSFQFSGITVWNLFPFDGEREWRYVNVSNDAEYQLGAHIINADNPEVRRGRNVYAVSYTKEDCRVPGTACVNGEEIYNILWSSDSSNGVFIHGYTQDGLAFDFDPPVQLATDTMLAGTDLTTSTGGVTFTSTFDGLAPCPVTFTDEWTDCGLFSLAAENAPNEGFPLVGSYYALRGRNVVALDLFGDFGLWEMARDECEGDCDGDW